MSDNYPYKTQLPPLDMRDIPNDGSPGEYLGINVDGNLDWSTPSGTGGPGGTNATNLTTTRNSTTVSVFSDTGTDVVLAGASTTLAGVMVSADKVKLNEIETGATANSSDATLLNRANHTGTQSSDTLTDGSTNRVFTTTEKTKLANIQALATANSSDATLLNRANHTGTQSADTITDGTTNKVFTGTEQTKLSGIQAGAEVNVNADWNSGTGDSQILNKPTLGGAAALNVGTTSGTVAAGDDARLSDARTPTAHKGTHQFGGADAIKLDDLATPDDNTDLNATTDRHGLLPKLGGGTTNFLRADGTWSAPSGDGGGINETNLTFTRNSTSVTVLSDTGTDAVLPAATTTDAGVMAAADKSKLDGIATGATANSSDATLLNRANHTGTQSADTITDGTTNKVLTAANNTKLGYIRTDTTNTALGQSALPAVTTGTDNVAVGKNANALITTGEQNVAIGSGANGKNLVGGYNVAIGHEACFENLERANVAIGYFALHENTTGFSNVSIGDSPLYSNTTGTDNIGIGYSALVANTTGSYNIAVGSVAGEFQADGVTGQTISNNSIFIGAQTKSTGNNQTNQIVIGHGAIGEGSNTVVLGNSSITSTKLRGTVTATAFVGDGSGLTGISGGPGGDTSPVPLLAAIWS